MTLEKAYEEVRNRIGTVDFSRLWHGFHPFKFALYNGRQCFFNGAYVEKTEEFTANTSIMYKGENIAIWNMMEEIDPDILASKLIHEMFHAFQSEQGENRFPDEMEALWKYEYKAPYLSAKLEENKLLAGLAREYRPDNFARLMALRKYRYTVCPYEYSYEAAVEQIEGTAAYVELNALKQISEEKYRQLLEKMAKGICQPENLLPIRVMCYDAGALFLHVIKERNIADFETFTGRPAAVALLDNVREQAETPAEEEAVCEQIEKYRRETRKIIQTALQKGDCAAQGSFRLLGVNIYNARCLDGYIVTTFFVMYEDQGKRVVLQGDFVLEMDGDGKISRIFRAELSR